jgi:hypothetical protein
MSDRRGWLAPVALALLLATAGCTTDTAETATPTDISSPGAADGAAADTPAAGDNDSGDAAVDDRPEISVRGTYDVNASLVFERVMDRLGEEGMVEPSVTVSGERIDQLEAQFDTSQSPVLSTFGLGNDSEGEFRIGAVTTSGYDVVLSPNLTDAQAEGALAHEFVHVAQQQNSGAGGWILVNTRRTAAEGYDDSGFDQSLASTLRVEGSAEYVERTYALEHLAEEYDYDTLGESREAFASAYRNQSGKVQYSFAPYYYGLEYFAERVGETEAVRDRGMALVDNRPPSDQPWSVRDVYRFTGGTTERLLHPDADNESLRIPDLSVTAADTSATVTSMGTAGELFTRIALDQELPRDRAIEAASGWGTDKLYSVDGEENRSGFLWVSRWDSPEEAAQFRSAMADFGDARPDSVTVDGEPIPTEFAVERPTADTVVTYVGSESLPETLSVTVDGGNVTVDDG